MRAFLALFSFLALPLAAAFGLSVYIKNKDMSLFGMYTLWTGRGSLAFLFLALFVPALSKVFASLPKPQGLQRFCLIAAYTLAAPHLYLFLFSIEATRNDPSTYEKLWMLAILAGVPALLSLAILACRATGIRLWKAPSRALLLFLLTLVVLHAHVVGNSFGLIIFSSWSWTNLEDPFAYAGDDPRPLGLYAAAGMFLLYLAFSMLAFLKIRLHSPIPRFSLLTLLLVIAAGFSVVILQKHLPDWSLEKRLSVGHPNMNWPGARAPNEIVSALSPNGSAAFTAFLGRRETILWNCKSGLRIPIQNGPSGPILNARFLPNGSKLLVASEEDVLHRVMEGSVFPIPVKILARPKDQVFTPNSSKLEDKVYQRPVVWIVDAQTGECSKPLIFENEERILNVSLDSARIFTCNMGNRAFHILNASNGVPLASHSFSTPNDQPESTNSLALPVNSNRGLRALVPAAPNHFEFFLVKAPAIQELKAILPFDDFYATKPWLSTDEKHVLLLKDGALVSVSIETGKTIWSKNTFDKEAYIVSSAQGVLCIWNGLSLLFLQENNGQLVRSESLHSRYDHRVSHNTTILSTTPHTFTLATKESVFYNPILHELSMLITSVDSFSSSRRMADIESGKAGYLESPTLSADGHWLLGCTSNGGVDLWKRRHSPNWWGLADVPEFWLSVALFTALAWSLWRDRKTMWKLAPRESVA